MAPDQARGQQDPADPEIRCSAALFPPQSLLTGLVVLCAHTRVLRTRAAWGRTTYSSLGCPSICHVLYCRLGCRCSGVPASTASKWAISLPQLARFLAPTRLVRVHNNGQNARRVKATTHGAPRTPWGSHIHPTSSSCCNAMLRTSISHRGFLHEGWQA